MPYVLAVELARGKLNDVRTVGRLEDPPLGLRPTVELDQALADAQHAFILAATSTDRPDVSLAAAQASLQAASCLAGDLYGCLYEPDPAEPALGVLPAANPSWVHVGCASSEAAVLGHWPTTFNTCHIGVTWKQIAPTEGRYSWEVFDALLAWERASEWPSRLGPSSIFARVRCPTGSGSGKVMARRLVVWSQTLSGKLCVCYKGKIPLWHLVHRMASGEILGLSEEDQIRIARCAIQVVRHHPACS